MKSKRAIWIRILAIVLVLLLAGVMAIIGRGHTVYFDNKTLEYNGETYPALYRTVVKVEGNKDAKLAKRERGMAKCTGQTFRMTVEATVNKGDEPTVYDIRLKLPYGLDGIVINLPGYLAGLPKEAYMSEFVSLAVETTPEDEEIITEDFGLGDI